MPHIVLLIDDNPVNLKLFKVLLGAAGYIVRTASDAEHARSSLQQMRPDLILMDIQLPGTDGLTLTRELKGNPSLSDIPVVALSACAAGEEEERAVAAGCAGYIAKPIDTQTFSQTVAGYLGAHARGARGREAAT